MVMVMAGETVRLAFDPNHVLLFTENGAAADRAADTAAPIAA